MDLDDAKIVQLELKYCERCGGLWVRPLGCEEIYCATCADEMMTVASSGKRKTCPRLPINHKTEGVLSPKLVVISGEGGNA